MRQQEQQQSTPCSMIVAAQKHLQHTPTNNKQIISSIAQKLTASQQNLAAAPLFTA